MLFNSIEFLIFFPIVTILFYLLPHKFRWALLLIASCVFYMWFVPQYILILLITIIIDYGAGLLMEKQHDNQRKKKQFLIISIISTCSVLFVFKYLGFFNENLLQLSKAIGFPYPDKAINIILPIGLSFHTFQSLSYVIEVYRGNQKAERNFGMYALYVMFYPQLVTGPIERPQNLLTQLNQKQELKYENIANGLRLILFGLFIKMVIADNLASYVDSIYAAPTLFNSWSIIIGMIFYSFQIYCDFYGYSTIALGCAKTMGYNITDNFRSPYLAKNINEFWHRWHISLSTWFRDYVYFPLGGNRVKLPRWMFNIMVVFLLSGLWHGANWTFLLWGFAHGILHIVEKLFNKAIKIDEPKKQWAKAVFNFFRITKTFLLVTLFWMFFRATDFRNIKEICSAILNNFNVANTISVDPKIWIFLGFFIIFDIVLAKSRFDIWCDKQHFAVRWLLYFAILFTTIVFASTNNYPFVYFQF